MGQESDAADATDRHDGGHATRRHAGAATAEGTPAHALRGRVARSSHVKYANTVYLCVGVGAEGPPDVSADESFQGRHHFD